MAGTIIIVIPTLIVILLHRSFLSGACNTGFKGIETEVIYKDDSNRYKS